jgi:hypothetical protein
MNAHLLLLDTASAGKRRIIMGDSAPACAVLMYCRCSSTRPRVIRCCRRPQLRARHSKQCGVETKLTIYTCQPVGSPHSMEEPP